MMPTWGVLASGMRCFVRLQTMNVKSRAAYAMDTWMEMVLFALAQGAGLAFLWVVFTKIHAVGGWTLAEVAFLYGLLLMSMALYRLGFQGVRDTGMMILDGTFDQVLTKPRSVMLILSCRRANMNGLGDLLMGLAFVLFAAAELDYTWTPARICQLLLVVVSSNAIMTAVMMAQAATCFWLVRFTVLHELIIALRHYCLYPLTIYGVVIRILLSSLVPLAFCSYYPAAVMLAKDGMTAGWIMGPPLVGMASLLLAFGLFRWGQGAYESTGS